MLDKTKQVTILVPTLNRSDFVLRLVDYYRVNNFAGQVLIGDSSDAQHFERVRARLAELDDNELDIVQVPCPGLGATVTFARLCEMIKTPYAAFAGDDDYLVPTGVAECVRFLDAHPEYVAAQGHGRTFELDRPGAYGTMTITGEYPMRAVEGDTAAHRFALHMHDYSVTLFGLFRTPVWRQMWLASAPIVDRAFGAELLPVCLSVVYGRVRLVNTLYVLRQGHPGTYHLDHPLDWFASPEWAPSYRIFQETLALEIARVDGMPKADAQALARHFFYEYLIADRNSLSFKVKRFRIKLVTKLMPVYNKLDRELPAPLREFVRRIATAVFNMPFGAINAPVNFFRWLGKQRASVFDLMRRTSHNARRAAKQSSKPPASNAKP